jgi:hypothetical protein
MTDIVERLRDPSRGSPRWGDTMAEAADEIERLRDSIKLLDALWHEYHDTCVSLTEERDRLREALRDIVEAWDWWQKDTFDRCQSVPGEAIADARAVLGEPAHG